MALFFLVAGAHSRFPLALRWRRRTVRGPAWDCGLPGLTADNEIHLDSFFQTAAHDFFRALSPAPGDSGGV